MKHITIEELVETIERNKNNKIKICLEGVINYKITMNNAKIMYEPSYITIFNIEDVKQKLKLNIHQIMQIDEVGTNRFEIYFDLLQTVKISV